jgi:pyridoxal phosphate enzyme (YggS family)
LSPTIKENVQAVLSQLPAQVTLVAAAKGQPVSSLEEAITAGVGVLGANYVQEAEEKIRLLGKKVSWHCIGHLQKNKVKKAVVLFDMIETVDSFSLAQAIDRESAKLNKMMPVLIEVNSAKEANKNGVLPQEVSPLLEKLMTFSHIQVMGLMTMGPFLQHPEDIRPFFKLTRELFEDIGRHYGEKLRWQYLSMGMSDTYRIAVQEGANIVRVGTAIFGERR